MFRNADVEKTQVPAPGQIGLDPRADRLADRTEANMCARAMSSEEIVAEFFKYHAPTERTIPKYAAINQAAKNFAEVVMANCPQGSDRSAAIRLIRDARMTANAAISLDGLSLY